jgi:hypothetical protein
VRMRSRVARVNLTCHKDLLPRARFKLVLSPRTNCSAWALPSLDAVRSGQRVNPIPVFHGLSGRIYSNGLKRFTV